MISYFSRINFWRVFFTFLLAVYVFFTIFKNSSCIVEGNLAPTYVSSNTEIQRFITIIKNASYIKKGTSSPSLLSTNAEVQKIYGPGDQGSFARGGKLLYDNLNLNGHGFFNLWAPGMILIHAIIQAVSQNAPIILIFAIIVSFLWGYTLLKLFEINRLTFIASWSFLTLTLFIISKPFDGFMNYDNILITEPISSAFLCLSFAIIKKGADRKSILFSGTLLALAAIFRAQIEMPLRICFFISIFYFLYYKHISDKKIFRFFSQIINKETSKKIFNIMLVFFMLTVPYRIYHKFSWVDLDYSYSTTLLLEDDFSVPDNFLNIGGGQVPCHINHKRCLEIRAKNMTHPLSVPEYKKEFFKIFIGHPIDWFNYKMPYMIKFWFELDTTRYSFSYLFNLFVNSSILIMIVSFLALFKRASSNEKTIFTIFFCYSFFVFLSTYMFHIEPRYFNILKLITLYTFFLNLDLFYGCVLNSKNFLKKRKIQLLADSNLKC
jgi:hypothetical protein